MTVFPVRIDRLEVWDSSERGRVLVGIIAPSPELAVLQKTMVEHLAGQGIEVSEHAKPAAFMPHIALAYGERLPTRIPALLGDMALLAYNVTLATPEHVLQDCNLVIESEKDRTVGLAETSLAGTGQCLLHVLRSEGLWRLLPHDFPPWKTV